MPKLSRRQMILIALVLLCGAVVLAITIFKFARSLPQPLADFNGEEMNIRTLEDYDAHVTDACERAYVELGQAIDFRAECKYSTVLNDIAAANEDLRRLAQEEMMAIKQYHANALSDEELRSRLVSGLTSLLEHYNVELGLEVNANHAEFEFRRYQTDDRITALLKEMLRKYGPCWGIPEGDCRE